MIDTILGIIAVAGFGFYAIPQTIAVHRATRLQGYSLTAWVALAAAVTGVLVQLVLSGVWVMAGAQCLNTASVYYNLWAIWRKS